MVGLLLGLFSRCSEWGCGAPASHCRGFPCCGAQALEHSLISCAEACGIFRDRRLDLRLLHWKRRILYHWAAREALKKAFIISKFLPALWHSIPTSQATTDLLSVTTISLACFKFYLNKIIQYALFLRLASLILYNIWYSFFLWHLTVDHLYLLLSNILSVDEHWSYLQLWALGTRSAKHMCVSLWVDIHFHSLG